MMYYEDRKNNTPVRYYFALYIYIERERERTIPALEFSKKYFKKKNGAHFFMRAFKILKFCYFEAKNQE